MANTVTNTQLVGDQGRVRINYLTLVSDGTEETDLVIYDSSARNTVDPLTCSILKIKGCLNILDHAAIDVRAHLEFDATTDVLALSLPINQPFEFDFTDVGGLKNYAGTGITGDIVLTTTGLESGDTLFLVMEVRP